MRASENDETSVLDFDEDEQTPEERKAEKQRVRSNRRKVLTVFFSIVLVLALAVGAVGAYYVHRAESAVDKIKRDPEFMPSATESRAPEATPTPGAKNGPVTFVLMGSDSRGADQGRSDSLIVAYLSGDRKKLYLISFLRDMWVDIPGKQRAKINAAYAWGGVPLTIRTLESLTDVKMQHAALIDFPGFIQLTETLGGVTVYNKQDSTIKGVRFPKGWITVKGETALLYVRERKDLANGDMDRAERQRDVIKAIIEKTVTPEVLANPALFGRTMDGFAQTMTVDSGLTTDKVNQIARSLRLNPKTDILSFQAPITGFGRSADGQSIAVVDEPKLKELAKAMQTDTVGAYHDRYEK